MEILRWAVGADRENVLLKEFQVKESHARNISSYNLVNDVFVWVHVPMIQRQENLSRLDSAPFADRARRFGVAGLGFDKAPAFRALIGQFDEFGAGSTGFQAFDPGGFVHILRLARQFSQGGVH